MFRTSQAPSTSTPQVRSQLASLLDAVDDPLLLVDAIGNLSFCNRAAMRQLGAEPGLALARLRPALGEPTLAWLRGQFGATANPPQKTRCVLPDGREARLHAWREGAQLALRVQWVASNTPFAADASSIGAGPTREMLRMLWASPFPATLQDAGFRLVAVNDAYLDFTGRTRDELIGTDPVALVPDEDRTPYIDARRELPAQLAGPTAPPLRDHRLIDAGGRERWCRVAAYNVTAEDGRALLLSVLQDSTAEHVARAQADRSLDELAQWFDLSPTGMLVFDETGLILRSNLAFEALVGQVLVSLADASPELQALLAWGDGAPRPGLRALATPLETHAALALPDGRRQRLSARVRGFATESGQARFMAVVEDRSAEEERDLAQLEIGALMDAAGVGVATFDSARGWLRPRAERRRAPGRAALQSIARDIVEPESLPEYERLQQALRRGERTEVRYAVRHPELGRRWLLTRVEPGDDTAGRRTVVTVDVTEQENAREAMVLQAERTRAILDSVLVGIVTVGEQGIEWMNRSARRMFAGDLIDFAGQPISTVATPEPEHPLRRTHYLHSLAEGQAETFECRLKARDGREFWVVGNAVVTGRGASGRQLTFALLDIERRRQAEISIAQAQASLQRIIETAPLAIALFDARTQRVTQLNQMAAAFFGRPLPEPLARTPAELLPPGPAQELADDLSAAYATHAPRHRELTLHAPDGARRWDVRSVPLLGAAGAAEHMLLVASDVTEQRVEAERRFEAALAQREMLVKEVHHRIKNNLQGVAGLLQQNAQRHPELAALLGESVGQVRAIAQVYGLQVGASGPLRVASVLEAIAASVQRTFGHAVPVQIEGDGPRRLLLPESEAIPIALTLNELLTNAVKHGGAARCTFGCRGDAALIGVSNAGHLPEGFDLARYGGGVSGLGLVRSLLPRRSATLALRQVGNEVLAEVTLTAPSVLREGG